MIPLLVVIGVPAVGYGWLASGVGEATVLILSARKYADFRIKPFLLPPTICAIVGASVGWLAASEVGATLAGGLVGALVAAAVYVVALWLSHRPYLVDSVHLSSRGLRQASRIPLCSKSPDHRSAGRSLLRRKVRRASPLTD